ncbi:hypothetical protein BSKO_08545 [Bryopsis sp. KO-2023]|nr:hypothetical protein BSKO_08545 [Bryopsis sp. KO-2023]
MSVAQKFAGPGSEELRSASCASLGKCSKDTPAITEDDLPQKLAAVPSWRLSDDKKSISREFVAKNFLSAVRFFQDVAVVAEAEGHHPDLHLTNYRSVHVVLSTHAIGALSMFDLILASKIDAIEVEYSPKWLREWEESGRQPAAP